MEPLRRVFRGYDAAQVDRLFAEQYAKCEGLEREVRLLREQNETLANESQALRSGLESRKAEESAVQEALISAHRQSEEVLSEARREAEVLLQVARETGARLQEDLRGRISDLNWQIERLSLQKQRFQNEFKQLLENHLSQLAEPEQPRLQLTEGIAGVQPVTPPADSEAAVQLEEPTEAGT